MCVCACVGVYEGGTDRVVNGQRVRTSIVEMFADDATATPGGPAGSLYGSVWCFMCFLDYYYYCRSSESVRRYTFKHCVLCVFQPKACAQHCSMFLVANDIFR